jgi:hypothetical protein
MNTNLHPNRYAMILDKDTIKSALERAAQWNLKPRVCRPLDTYTGKAYNAELQSYDRAIENSAITDEELPEDADDLHLEADDAADLDI